MVLRGSLPGEGERASETHTRISWSKVDGDPDRVRQHWEASADGGDSWTTVFDERYLRVP